MSSIDGEMSANGQVFIINPAGILFGENAFINVGGLIATDLNGLDNFIESDTFTLSDPSAAEGGVTNLGVLRATTGGIALVGQQIVNAGEIQTRAGDAQLIAASGVEGAIDENGRIGYELTEPVRVLLPGSEYLIENSLEGVVVSIDGGDIVYSTRFIEEILSVNTSIDQSGTDNLLGITNQPGNIYVTETPVQETLFDTVIDEVVTRDSEVGTTDASETLAASNDSEDLIASAETEELQQLDEDTASEGGDNAEEGSAAEESKEEKQKIAKAVDPDYFAKLRKTNIDQLIPDCNNPSVCQQTQATKDFLEQFLVDGAL